MKDQDTEIAQLKAENELIRKQALPHRSGAMNVPTQNDIHAAGTAVNTTGSPMGSSVAKVVQPTATVSSIPVSGPSELST